MRIARNLAIVAMLTLVALVTLAPRSCPSCSFEKINTKFDEQAFVMEIVALRVDRESGVVRGIAEIVANDGGDTFRAATFSLRFGGELDRATGLISGKGKFELKDDPDDLIINAFGTLRFQGALSGVDIYDVTADGKVNITLAE